MLLVRSMTRTTSTGLDGAVPHGPLHAAETTSPVEPWLTPTTRPKLNGVLAAPAIRTALQRSPTAGLQDEKRVGPEPAKSDASGGLWPSEKCGSHTERHVARDVRLRRSRGVDPDQALVADRVRGARQPRVVGLDRRGDESVDLGGVARDRAVHRQQRAAGQGGGVEAVDQRLAVVPQQPDIDDERRERQDDDQHEREEDDDLSSLALPVPPEVQHPCPLSCHVRGPASSLTRGPSGPWSSSGSMTRRRAGRTCDTSRRPSRSRRRPAGTRSSSRSCTTRTS